MAGAIAVAAVMEDFESQPCKKSRKDGDLPLVKTITNYFISKPMEKLCSPPKGNNIMDYFKKSSPPQDVRNPVSKGNSQQSLELIPVKSAKAQGRKRSRKAKDKKTSSEQNTEVIADSDVEIVSRKEAAVEENDQIPCHVYLTDSNTKLTAGADQNTDNESSKPSSKQSRRMESCSQTGEEKEEKVKQALQRRTKKGKSSCQQAKERNSDSQVAVNDTESERNAEDSLQKSSTVTISFKDFLNQSGELKESDDVPKSDQLVPESVTEGKDPSECALDAQQVSPRTLMVQAEIHPISPDFEQIKVNKELKKELKVASIFSRNKKHEAKEVESPSSPDVKMDLLPHLKRKSNVVLLDDLELDVIESNINPRSSEAERKQFMSAFKQPNLDGFKNKSSKSQSNQNQVQEKSPEVAASEGKSLDDKPEESVSERKDEIQNTTGQNKKRVRKGGKKGPKAKAGDISDVAPKPIHRPDAEILVENGSSPNDFKTGKTLRRSTRELSRRQQTTEPIDVTAQKNKIKKKETTLKEHGTKNKPSLVSYNSTPKIPRCRKVYRAEMLCPPDLKGSPIRMRIARVLPSSASKDGFEISSPISSQETKAAKKQNPARKLVQKAKAFQQSKKESNKPKDIQRRSTRSNESLVSYCEDEDSVVFLDKTKIPPSHEDEKKQKTLRSVSDVLGKNASQNKVTSTACKLAPLFLEKKAQRSSSVISIFDDSSREASETSQDDEQFRAKREFLKSGLPESFRKQIAKSAASREAYSQSSASFQEVTHVQQRSTEKLTDGHFWNLKWPANPLLNCLKETNDLSISSEPLSTVSGMFGYTTVSTKREFISRVTCRSVFSEPVQQRLLEELRISNPSFPHQRFFTRFVKKHDEYVRQAFASSELESTASVAGPSDNTKKRKRVDGEASDKVGKKLKSIGSEEDVIVIEDDGADQTGRKAPSRSRRGRLQRQKQKEVSKPSQKNSVLPDSVTKTSGTEGGIKEDVLWTEKYQPQHSSEVIGNMDSVRKLHSWLTEWKLRADHEEKNKQQEKKHVEDSNDSWFTGDSAEGLDDAEALCNTLLITGPTGVGKTAAVYACAHELGFKVFEVNSSAQRSGRQILSQLKEATQSHQVDIQGVNTHKPSYFNSYSGTSTTVRPGTSPRKVKSPRRVVSSPRKPPQSPRSLASRRGALTPTSLASFFKAGGRTLKNSQDKKAPTECQKKAKDSDGKGKESPAGISSKVSSEDQGKRTATSLILFEEVDIIFDDDSGFLTAIKTFMATTKRPVILTTSDPHFAAAFDGNFEEIYFKSPSVADTSSYLQLLCLAESIRTDREDVSSLLEWSRCDVRQSLLQLQFWACSGDGGQRLPPALGPKVEDENLSIGSGDVKDDLPPCHTACTENFLGIHNVESEKLECLLLRSGPSVLENTKCWDLLSELQKNKMDLLYSNMESLLPLPSCLLPQSNIKSQPASNTPTQAEQVPSSLSLILDNATEDSSPLKVSSRMRGKKRLAMASKEILDSDSEDEFVSLKNSGKGQRTSTETEDLNVSKHTQVKPKCVALSEAERKKNVPVSECLSGFAEYMDTMSFLDSSLHYHSSPVEGFCRPQDFGWTGAEVKTGMTDDIRLESVQQNNGICAEEVRAILGHLSFRKCRDVATKAWDKVQELKESRQQAEEELTLPVAPHRNVFSLTRTTLCSPSVLEKRSEVMQSVVSSRSAGLQGNRPAAALDYLPSLRTICRLEKLKEQEKTKRRFLHYLDGIHFSLPKSTVEFLSAEFP